MPEAPSLLSLLSVVIPARNEEGCIVSTIEHLHSELGKNNVPHEIVVVDDAINLRAGIEFVMAYRNALLWSSLSSLRKSQGRLAGSDVSRRARQSCNI